MKLKVLAAVLALVMLLSACGRKKNSYKSNISGYTGNGGSSSEGQQAEQEEQKEQPEESGELVCTVKNTFYVGSDGYRNEEYPLYIDKYYYDADGNLVREEEYGYNEDKYQTVVSYATYEYDEDGRCVHKYSQRSDVIEEYYEYDAAGNLTKKETYLNGNKSSESRWDYDDRGSAIAYYEPDKYGDGLKYTSEYEYNADGTVRSKTSYEADYGHQSRYEEYAYDAEGRLIRCDVTSWGDYQGYWEYVYDDYGVLIEKHRYNEYGTEDDEKRELYSTEYDEAGNQITYADLYTTGYDRGTPRYTDQKTYDSEGNMVRLERYDYDGKLDNLYTYEYAPLSSAIWTE